MGAWQAGSRHSLCAPKAVWFTGGWWRKAVWEPLHSFPCFWEPLCSFTCFWESLCSCSCFWEAHLYNHYPTLYPTLPLFSVFWKLIPPSDIFEVKIWRVLKNNAA
jgi:hypothetical protein